MFSRWSDIAYLAWSNYQGGDENAHYLQFFIQAGAGAPDTLAVIREHWGPNPWPGRDSPVLTEAGLTLLGTSNGCALSWMILQHNYFQNRIITETKVWGDSAGNVMILQQLGDSPVRNSPVIYTPPNPPGA